jgi:1-acyl-sn-glycerol-3-phosphate acyltransferase
MHDLLRAARGVLFLLVYAVYLIFFFGLPQRFLVWPLAVLLPRHRVRIVGFWFRKTARSTLGLARLVAGVRVKVEGSVPPGSFVFVMNHQSLLDIPICHAQMKDPYPVIPTRALYARGVPGISPLIRLGRFPLVYQTKASRRQDLLAIARAAEAVARGELSLLIYPEGHRSRDGEIGPFMRAGLRSILQKARRPVYLLVVDGFWRARTTKDTLCHFAGTRGVLRILGPFPPPAEDALDAYVDELRERMVRELHALRGAPAQGRAETAT